METLREYELRRTTLVIVSASGEVYEMEPVHVRFDGYDPMPMGMTVEFLHVLEQFVRPLCRPNFRLERRARMPAIGLTVHAPNDKSRYWRFLGDKSTARWWNERGGMEPPPLTSIVVFDPEEGESK